MRINIFWILNLDPPKNICHSAATLVVDVVVVRGGKENNVIRYERSLPVNMVSDRSPRTVKNLIYEVQSRTIRMT